MIKIYKNLISFFAKFIRFFYKSITLESYITNHEQFLDLKVPYISKRATIYIEKLINDKKYLTCFEWGSGGSTLWLESKMSKITSVEESDFWFKLLKNKINPDITNLIFVNTTESSAYDKNNYLRSQKSGFKNKNYFEYAKCIDNFGKFDLIIIDGRVREACLYKALNHLNKKGAIIFDDTYRKRYKKVIKSLDNKLYKLKNIYGLSRFQLKISKVTIITSVGL